MHTPPLRRLLAAMTSSVLGMVLLATTASSAAPAPPAVTPEPLTDPAFSYNRAAEYAVAKEDVRVPLRDGSWVACQMYRPADPISSQPAAGTFPGIVYEYTAYADNAEAFGEGAGYFVRRGYNALVCQARGSGESPGELDPFSPQEQRDNYDVIEWLANHPASTGDIGQMGLSYGGHSTLLAAVNRPPHLRAIIPINGFHDWYEDTIYHGGIYSARIRGWQAAVAPETLTTYAEHPLYDDFWSGRSVMSRWENLTIPTLEINGWYDRYRDGMVKNYLAQPDNVWLVSGPWEHGYPEGQHAEIGPGVYLAWWDHWLAGDEDAPLPQSRVTSYEIPGPGAGTGWQQFRQWPPADAHQATLKLRSDGALGRASGPAGVETFDVNTETTPPERSERLIFATPPKRRDVVLAGSGRARVRAAFSADDGNIAAILYDQAPDGAMVRITEGWLKASHRRGHRSLAPVEPGSFHTLDVHIRPTHYRLEQGHRLVLRISSDDYPAIDSDAPAGQVEIAVGARGSSLTLTVRGRSASGR
jgi:uncharacterized protein